MLLGDSLQVKFLRCLSILGRTLFHICIYIIICINNLEEDTASALIKFADAKSGDASDLLKGRASIQRDLEWFCEPRRGLAEVCEI